MYQSLRRRFEAPRTTRVSIGSWPWSSVKILAKIGTMNMSIATSTRLANVKTTVG